MNYIYKITNKLNGKVYIGLTTTTIEKRWKAHLRSAKKEEKHLYSSMRKYGTDNFIIEEIDRTEDFEELGRLERKYIKEYDSANHEKGYNNTRGGERCQLDGNPRTRLTIEDVENIRQIYAECKIGAKEAWLIYKDRVSYDAFEKIYEGTTWKSVKPEVFTSENKIAHKKMAGSKLVGEKNPNAILSNDEVYTIRKYYVNHTLSECYAKFGEKFSSIDSFRCVIDCSYVGVPIYKKNQKIWITGNDDVTKIRTTKDDNEIRIFNDYAEIDTYDISGKKAATFKVDLGMVDFLKTQKWRCCNGKNTKKLQGRGGKYYHSILLGFPNSDVVYKDGDCFNLLRDNLTTEREKIDTILSYENLDIMYNKEKLTIADISNKCGISRGEVTKKIKEYRLKKL